jgi:hypothetical protein
MRTYGIVLGAVTCALNCWQSLGLTVHLQLARWITLFGLFTGLAFAILCHVFAIFVLIPFALGQAVRDWKTKRIDFAAWAATLLAPVCLLVEVPGLSAAHRMYAGLFWSKPSGGQILFSYNYAVGIGWLVAALLVVLAWPAIVRIHSSFSGDDLEQINDRGFTAPEWTLIGALALLPLFAWPLSHLLGVYVPRYVLPLTIGLALVVVAGTAEALKRNRIAGAFLAAAFVVVFFQAKRELIFGALQHHPPLSARFEQLPWVQALEKSSLPVLAPNTPIYTQMQHYVPAQLEQRLFYTLHTPAAIRPAEDLDAELSMKLFSSRLPLRVEEFSSFAAKHSSFLLIVKSPLDPGRAGNLTVQAMGSYNSGELLNFAQFFVYRVDVGSTSPGVNGVTANGARP